MSAEPETPCPQCKSQNVEIGRIRGTGRLVAEDDWTLVFSGRKVITTACLDCGHIWLRLKDIPSK
ncbi:MAG TPA: hypothetical protein VFG04_09235 [Planctomycetaceae bacterium]|jgi:hypothetical protein|nr:hypothetical protein [Planctomycetaceae bacterium]